MAPLVALLVGLAVPQPAAAHAELASSEPPANASLPEAPAELTLEFTEAIDPATASVRLLDELQNAVGGVGELTTDAAGTRATVPLPALEPGVYTVDYRVVSAVDGHVTAGIFAFLVDPTGVEPAPEVAPTSEAPAADLGTVVARWVALLGLLVMVGTVLFWLLSARAGWRASGAALPAPWVAIAGSGFLAFAGHAVYLTLAARPFTTDAAAVGDPHALHPTSGGFPFDFAAPFGATPFAIAMRVVLVASAIVFVLAAARLVALDEARRRGRPFATRWETPLLAAVLLSGLTALAGASFAGHAASYGGPAFAAVDWLHLVAVAAWLGVLPGVALLAWQAWRHGRRADGLPGAALRAHARTALVAAPFVALTGIANSPLVLGDSRGAVASGYGNLLLAKAALFSVGVAIGSANFFLLRRLAVRRALPLLAGEALVGVLAVLAAAGMVTIQPAATRVPTLSAPQVGTAHLYGTAGETSVHAAVSVPAPGEQQYQLAVAEVASGAPRDDVQRVFMEFRPPPEADLPPQRVELEAGSTPGIYGATGAYTPLTGEWQLEVIVRRAGERDESASFVLPVRQPAPPEPVPPPDTGVGVPAPLALVGEALPSGPLAWMPALLLLALAGALASVEAWRRRRSERHLRWSAPLRAALVSLAIVAGLGAATQGAVALASAPPADVAAVDNPVPASDASIERGRLLYQANCVSCHGQEGEGDGPAAAGMLPAPDDLSEAVRDQSDGALEYRVRVGIAGTRMPAFAGTLSVEDRWHLVNYLRSRWGRGP